MLIADELISMLDASTRMGILNLLADICQSTGMSVLFITHDLALGYYISDYTMIMHRGRLVEQKATAEVYHNPIHPYTRMLFRQCRISGTAGIKGEVCSRAGEQRNCRFYASNSGRASPGEFQPQSVDEP